MIPNDVVVTVKTAEERYLPDTPKLGDRAKDVITGFKGIIVCRIEELSGAVEFDLEADGMQGFSITPRTKRFAAARVRVIEKGVCAPEMGEGA